MHNGCARLTLAFGAILLLASCAIQPAIREAESQVASPDPGWAKRVQVVTQRRDDILRSVQTEDAARKGKIKRLLVFEQLEGTARRALELHPGRALSESKVAVYEAACAALEVAYLASLLESTDPASDAAWSIDERRDVLGSPTVDAKLAAWQGKDPNRPFVKFAVVPGEGGRGAAVRVGPFDVSHVDIAGGHALSAGLLQARVIDGKMRVVVLENTSGGFRPGPLRNQTTLRAIDLAGYLPLEAGQITVHDNVSGGYETSQLVR